MQAGRGEASGYLEVHWCGEDGLAHLYLNDKLWRKWRTLAANPIKVKVPAGFYEDIIVHVILEDGEVVEAHESAVITVAPIFHRNVECDAPRQRHFSWDNEHRSMELFTRTSTLACLPRSAHPTEKHTRDYICDGTSHMRFHVMEPRNLAGSMRGSISAARLREQEQAPVPQCIRPHLRGAQALYAQGLCT
jgi:hypothetical protein